MEQISQSAHASAEAQEVILDVSAVALREAGTTSTMSFIVVFSVSHVAFYLFCLNVGKVNGNTGVLHLLRDDGCHFKSQKLNIK